MNAATYPTDIVTHDGWARIWPGHNLDRAVIESDYRSAHGVSSEVVTEEVHFTYQPHVKWCGNYGDACEYEGEWHRHWHEVKPSFGCEFTLVRGAK